ncbi:hypothetical protein [Streptomyces sp. NRRL S-1022]|uniref:hypothetical protein n=1 Tax=Streptomyces sp. NRRL S-1022 TaxID=1463880 RepID=UPI0004C08FA2|nr:hypothetical protein [Streptomyces sp. NRRL S-1022]
MAQHSAQRPTGEAGTTRSVGELLLTFMAGSVLLPLLQGVTGKAGEDIYSWVRGLFPGRKAEEIEERLTEEGQICVVDSVRRLVFELPADLTARETAAILSLRLPSDTDTWLLVRKDYARRIWVIEPTDAPPERSVEAAAPDTAPDGSREAGSDDSPAPPDGSPPPCTDIPPRADAEA